MKEFPVMVFVGKSHEAQAFSDDDPRFQCQRQGAKMAEPSTEHDLVARQIVDAAFAVHSTLGPGLLESVYQQCLASELANDEWRPSDRGGKTISER